MARLEVGALAGRAISVMAGNISLMSRNSSAASAGGGASRGAGPVRVRQGQPRLHRRGPELPPLHQGAGLRDGAAKRSSSFGWCAMLFVAIGTVGDAFFARWNASTRLRLPDDVAGATLSLGGAAPDIFTQIAALVEAAEVLRLRRPARIHRRAGSPAAVRTGARGPRRARVGGEATRGGDLGRRFTSAFVRRKRPSLAAGRRRGAVSVKLLVVKVEYTND